MNRVLGRGGVWVEAMGPAGTRCTPFDCMQCTSEETYSSQESVSSCHACLPSSESWQRVDTSAPPTPPPLPPAIGRSPISAMTRSGSSTRHRCSDNRCHSERRVAINISFPSLSLSLSIPLTHSHTMPRPRITRVNQAVPQTVEPIGKALAEAFNEGDFLSTGLAKSVSPDVGVQQKWTAARLENKTAQAILELEAWVAIPADAPFPDDPVFPGAVMLLAPPGVEASSVPHPKNSWYTAYKGATPAETTRIYDQVRWEEGMPRCWIGGPAPAGAGLAQLTTCAGCRGCSRSSPALQGYSNRLSDTSRSSSRNSPTSRNLLSPAAPRTPTTSTLSAHRSPRASKDSRAHCCGTCWTARTGIRSSLRS